MKRVVFEETDTINLDEIKTNQPVFAEKGDSLIGMVVLENEGYILRIGGNLGAYGYSNTLKECIIRGQKEFGYEFFVEC